MKKKILFSLLLVLLILIMNGCDTSILSPSFNSDWDMPLTTPDWIRGEHNVILR
ncbi:MAG: hypothetical protein PF518_19500 [Spirochaetaceae bacterium]|jgi:hypothetical protein|nr:hypothetical protein [Spirochaetaceae bacterium]